MTFPRNARTGQTHKKFGRKYAYSETTETWAPIVPLASVTEVRKAEAAAASATQIYALATELPLSGNTTGAMAFVQETDRLYVWSGTGWYNIATISAAGASISGANATYTLATDGTPTVVTLTQSGLTSPTWSYEVTSGSIGRTAVVTQVANVFTITPSTLAKNVGSFGITFKATDGSNTIVKTSQFSMSNTAPVISTAPNATYTLAKDGTPTVITLAATDADGHDITWSYEVLSGSLGGTTVSIDGSEFTITPSTDTNDAGTFQLRFIASDGASFDADVSEFELGFGPTYSYTINNPNDVGTSFLDWYGASIDADESSGKFVAGAPQEKFPTVQAGSGETGAGTVYVHDASDGSLSLTLTNPNAAGNPYDNFGKSVSISGNTVLVGAPNDDLTATNNGEGRAYLYNATTGALLKTWDSPNGAALDAFGISTAISDNYIAITALGENSVSYDYAGAVYVYNNASPYNLLYRLATSIPATEKYRFGHGLKIVGDHLFISAPRINNNNGRIFVYDLTTGNRVAEVGSDINLQDFGISFDVSGNYLVVGCHSVQFGYGRVFLYKTELGDWSDITLVRTTQNPRGTDVYRSYDYFGWQVGINSTYYVATSPDMEANALESGKPKGGVFVYDIITGNLLSTLYRPDNVNGVEFGYGASGADTMSSVLLKQLKITETGLWVSDYKAADTSTQSGKVFKWDL